MVGLLPLASIAIAVLAATIPYAFIASAVLIGAMSAASFLKQNVSAGLFWVLLASLVILVLGTAFGMISTLFLTPADAVTVDSAPAVPDFG
ncbi:hypothetical protein ACH46_20640 [Gordonia phthalatica]|uniref:Uncharacterized protein n=2 Tax=Gordonia phthalatica TaxID=1136941 RepID=A0A0N9MTJ7_9ACTN|nr:hypothetical protein ACH46_20640 [Gordonia phthalatica]